MVPAVAVHSAGSAQRLSLQPPGGLVFIGATNFDRNFRAFDKDTGKLLWETVMVNSGNATPITYEVNGKQFVVIAAFGGYAGTRPGRSGGAFVAFALP